MTKPLTFPNRAPVFEVHERSYEESDHRNISNWMLLKPELRDRCVQHLRASLHSHPDIIQRWKDQLARGMKPGSDQVTFHFGGGQAVRNILRQVVGDYRLPGVPHEATDRLPAHDAHNWDDYYIGAIDALAKEP